MRKKNNRQKVVLSLSLFTNHQWFELYTTSDSMESRYVFFFSLLVSFEWSLLRFTQQHTFFRFDCAIVWPGSSYAKISTTRQQRIDKCWIMYAQTQLYRSFGPSKYTNQHPPLDSVYLELQSFNFEHFVDLPLTSRNCTNILESN